MCNLEGKKIKSLWVTGLNPLKKNLNLLWLLRPCHRPFNTEPKLLFFKEKWVFYLNKKEISTSMEPFGILTDENKIVWV